MNFSLTLSSAWALAKKLLAKIFAQIGSEKVLSVLGDVIAIAFPHLEKEHWVELGNTLRSIDPDHQGLDDEVANIFFELGGRADLVVTGDDILTLESPDVPVAAKKPE